VAVYPARIRTSGGLLSGKGLVWRIEIILSCNADKRKTTNAAGRR